MDTIAAFFGGLALRAVRLLVDSSPYILLGFAASGLLRAAVGPVRLRRAFGDGRWSPLVRAWGAATLLPVCALGVLPILRELRRSGVRRDVVLTFALAAPMFNPVSLLSASSHLGPSLLAGLLGASAAIAILAGAAAGRGGDDPDGATDEPRPAAGRPRGAAAAAHALREASGPAWIDLAVGMAVAAAVSALVDPAWLAEGTFAGDPTAVARMAAVAAPAYVSPEVGVTALPEMVKFRQAAGAMLALVVLGVGLTAGHLAWAARSYGLAATARWAAALLVATFAGACAIDLGHVPVGVVNPDNDHYDVLASPIPAGHAGLALKKIGESIERAGAARLAAPAVLALAIAAGAASRRGWFGSRSRFEDWAAVELPPAEGGAAGGPSLLDRPLPAWLGRAIVASAALAAVLAGAGVAFPSPEETFRDMSVIKADFYGEIGAADASAPLHHLGLWERSAGRLPIGAALRLRFPDAEARRLTRELAASLRELRDATTSHDPAKARALFQDIQATYARCRRAYAVE